uniref:Uncharacterized protein n=1 Tax=Siphoviridae sp. ct5FX1 TaxID=2825335 RepID=A0A8S5UPQ9_9CAUD|nr:MAG TPA: hypothetical protein [Siphoviridae sp. ct5FX1]
MLVAPGRFFFNVKDPVLLRGLHIINLYLL